MIRSLSAFSFGLSSHNRLYYPYRMRYFLVEHAVKNAFPKFDVARIVSVIVKRRIKYVFIGSACNDAKSLIIFRICNGCL